MTQRDIIPMKRINTRITQEQNKYIKSKAKKLKLTEGEVFRFILNNAMADNK